MASTYRPTRPPRRSTPPPRDGRPTRASGPRSGSGSLGGRSRHRQPLTNFRFNASSPFRHVDVVLLGTTLLLVLCSAVLVYSATRGSAPPYVTSDGIKVLVFGTIGAVAMVAAALFDYRLLRDYWFVPYALVNVLLLAVLVPGIGKKTKGTQGWLALPGFQLQPSELAKIGMIIGFAGLATQFRGDLDLRRIGMLLGVCGLPMALVLLQPDLGTALVSVAVAFGMLLVAGVPSRILGALALAAVLLVALVLTSGTLKAYQVDRLTTYTRQSQKVTTQAEFNLVQSKRAIGSGGVTGKGLFNGPFTRTGNVPEQRTDFIFTAVGEQFGLVGCGVLLSLLGVLVWRVWRAAQLAKDDLGMIICTGVMVMIMIQTFENVGMTIGIMPITGIPLPLTSYGGSALISTMLSLGLVQSVHMRRFQ
jgi:rod shape determining protein RodA